MVFVAPLTFRFPVSVNAPEIDSDVSVPTEVSEDVTTVEFNVVPVRVPAAAVTVISAVPLNETPLIFRAVASDVAVAALPLMLAEIVEEKV